MTTRTMSGKQWWAVFALLLALTASGEVFAQERGHSAFSGHEGLAHGENSHSAFSGHEGLAHGESDHSAFDGHEGLAHEHIDGRFSHNQPYLDRSYTGPEAPRGGDPIDQGHEHYRYDRGQWYRRQGPDWAVAAAPVGAFVSVLPPFYTTVWFGGAPYYYADDTYYQWDRERQEYQVAEPPAGFGSARTAQPPPSDSTFVYPRYAPSSEQQASDRYACVHSAVEQTGYDPTQPSDGVPPEVTASKRADYLSIEAACLDASGYSVK